MTKSPEEIIKKHQEKYQDEKVEDRTSRWVLGTIKYQYDFGNAVDAFYDQTCQRIWHD